MNPFAQNTSSTLFSWKKEKLLKGGSKFEFRINESPFNDVKEVLTFAKIHAQWVALDLREEEVIFKHKKDFLSKFEKCEGHFFGANVLDVHGESVQGRCQDTLMNQLTGILYLANSLKLSGAIGVKEHMKSTLKDRTLSGTILVICRF